MGYFKPLLGYNMCSLLPQPTSQLHSEIPFIHNPLDCSLSPCSPFFSELPPSAATRSSGHCKNHSKMQAGVPPARSRARFPGRSEMHPLKFRKSPQPPWAPVLCLTLLTVPFFILCVQFECPFLFSRLGESSIPVPPHIWGGAPTPAAPHRKFSFLCTFPEMRHSLVFQLPQCHDQGRDPHPQVLNFRLALWVFHWPVFPVCSDLSRRLALCFPQALEWDWHPSNSLSPPSCIF